MPKLYLFGIGGTGSRVLKAFTMLLASGIKMGNDFNEVVPVIIDPDKDNADLTYTSELMKSYIEIRKSATKNDTLPLSEPSFFFTKITPSNNDNFRLDMGNQISDQTFEQFINMSNLEEKTKKFTKLLFSEENLNSSMNKGFLGQPNIGSVVFNKVFSAPNILDNVFQNFQEGDRIFIVSSIFGGTGAAGFPVLFKKIRDTVINNNLSIVRSIIGGTTVLPYFKVTKNRDGAEKNCPIDSSTFMSKTKAALQYYKNNLADLNTIYYIGDESGNEKNTYTAWRGGKEQKNKAHFIEFASAAAIINFANSKNETFKNDQGAHNPLIVKEFGIKDVDNNNQPVVFENTPINFYHLTGDEMGKISETTTSFYLLSRFFDNSVLNALNKNHAWTKKLNLPDDYINDVWFDKLKGFSAKYFKWLEEMKDNYLSFSPFKIYDHGSEERALDVLCSKSPKKELSEYMKRDYPYIRYQLNKNAKTKDIIDPAADKSLNVLRLFSHVFFNITRSQYND
mgnify:CR=1 FL=1